MSYIANSGVSAGGTVPSFADGETPTGAVDGVNTTYTLAHAPSPAASLDLFQNGVSQVPGGTDFTLAGSTITMAVAPLTGDVLLAFYRY